MNHILLFYSGSKLAVLKSTQEMQRIFRSRDLTLAEMKTMDVALAALDHRQTPVLLAANKARQSFAFTPFGHMCTTSTVNIGFTGELLDRASGCYLLGAGHRSYSPALMRFQSADTQSPFLRGGINAYGYCSSDPLNYSDPSGQVRWRDLKSIRRIFQNDRSQTPAQPTLPPYSPPSSEAIATENRPSPPTYFGWGEPPPQYDQLAPQMINGNQTRPYSVIPKNGELVLEMHNGKTRVVNSLVEITQANAQARNPALPAAAALKASNTLFRMSRNNLPTQTDNGILAAIGTAHQLYDIRGVGTIDAPDPTQSLSLPARRTRRA
jgi:RHS repeat-associated protein